MIELILNEERYENDIRALLMAFYHGEKILARKPENMGASERKKSREQADGQERAEDSREQVYRKMEAMYVENHLNLTLKDADGQVLGRKWIEDFPKDHKAGKNCVKTALYELLCEVTGRTLPWGTLTGIRPTKIPMAFYDGGHSREEAAEHLRQIYKVSEEKIRLCTKVAANEKRILEGIDEERSFSLYVGIPFCPTICLYCSFSSYPLNVWAKEVDNYLDALFKEIRQVSRMVDPSCLTTVYMGGGTPTTLAPALIERVLGHICQSFDMKTVREFTVEAGRPDTVDADKLKAIKPFADRICINPQSLSDDVLQACGRRHTAAQFYEAFSAARRAGFNNINCDIMINKS